MYHQIRIERDQGEGFEPEIIIIKEEGMRSWKFIRKYKDEDKVV